MKYISLLILFLVMGCGENAEEKEKRLQEEKQQHNKELKASTKEQLIKSYNAIVGWDSTKVFTYWYQENLCGEQKKVYFEGRVQDIIKVDSANYAVKIINLNNMSHRKNFLIECVMTQEQKTLIEKNIKSIKGIFIIQVNSVKRFSPALSIENDYESDVFLQYDFEQELILIKGSLIDFMLFEG